jgi:uncharacterized protein YbbK (DUF523 family)
MKIVSACLAGKNCKWNGKNNLSAAVKKMVERGEAIAVCPEELGGLPTPRKPCGIHGGLGADVINGKARIRASRGDGEDMTEQFLKGAKEFLKIAKSVNAEAAILHTPSPSCGCGRTWRLDDKFANHMVKGDGVVTALLKENGIKVKAEGTID